MVADPELNEVVPSNTISSPGHALSGEGEVGFNTGTGTAQGCPQLMLNANSPSTSAPEPLVKVMVRQPVGLPIPAT